MVCGIAALKQAAPFDDVDGCSTHSSLDVSSRVSFEGFNQGWLVG